MKTPRILNSGLLKIIIFSVFACMLKASEIKAQGIRFFGVSDLVRVFEDGYKLPTQYDTLKVFGIRGEIISGQCVLISKKDLKDLSVEVSSPVMSSGKKLSSENIQWNFVGSIYLSANTSNQPVSALSRPAPASYPEYLMAEKQINLDKGIYQSVWLTINIPQNADPGIYNGNIKVKSLQGEQSLPLTLTIYPLTLAEERHLKVVEWYTAEDFEKYHGISEKYSDGWFSMLKLYADNMAAHRQNVFRVPMSSIEIRKNSNGNYDFDFSRFDQIAEVFWNTGKMDGLETGFLTKFGEGDWFSTEISLNDIKVIDNSSGEMVKLPGAEVVPFLLPAFESHLRQKGWLDKTLFHVKDEPSLHNSLAWMEMSAYLHHLAPDLRRIDAIETTYLLDDIEVAVPKLDALATWYDTYRSWEQKGNELWFYTVGIYQGSSLPNKTIDMPLIDSRIMHWLNYKYDASGYLHWGWNQWEGDPFKDVGMHFGDAWHVYPVKDGVLNSLRWEEMRNGIQDYEYFCMLEDKVRLLKDSLGFKFDWIDPLQRSKEIASSVVVNFVEHNDDPMILNNARLEIIREMMEFETSPRVYVQTEPPENSTLQAGSPVAVYGWAEPGSKIIINGNAAPLSIQGLFLGQYTLTPAGNKIIIEISNSKGRIQVNRNFTVDY